MHRPHEEHPDSPIDQPTLQTQRLILRALTVDDAAAINELLGDKQIAANTQLIPFPYSIDLAREWIEPQARIWQEGRAAVFAICLANQSGKGSVIGVVGLEVDSAHERGELGYWVGVSHWGKGYCTEAASAVIEFGFEQLGLHRIFAYHMIRNPASGRVMQKLGMSQEGVLRHHAKKWGVFEDVAIFGILRPSTAANKS